MGRYILRRLALMILSLWVIVTATFILMNAVPGGPFTSVKLTPLVQKQLERKYGLDKPKWQQYVTLLKNLCRFDLGLSIRERGRSVNDIIRNTFPTSAVLGIEALVFAVSLGLTLGIIAALHRGKALDYTAIIIAIIGVSVPNFVVASVLQYVVGYKLKLLPIARWESFKHTILPAFSLGLGTLATMTRMMRSSMLEVLSQDYIRTAKAKGLTSAQIVWRHGVRNAILPIVTILGPLIAGITTGTFVIERMFGIPGLGKYFVESIYNRDYPMIMGTTVFYSALLLFMTFLVDIAYGLVDPRIRLARGKGD
ncbi:MAG: ABC transporter permease [Bacillota bacterium]|jgi:ABC-type dipeptide/oligopeptide/nickel transport system permease component|nr:ABC transporter permease [Candidatus Fermentithermobacillaceae bacterium]HOA71444.1 ABC transporter permease [Bacillota bacterium]HOP70260.1 ABC transporter permease [Bacillota bacterium]HPT35621.1 ABC transporter permease [Bacillota bacterium]HPZ85994.1 ABC transporter permease [Bacillota bacterium]